MMALAYVGDNVIQNFHLGRHIVGYMVRNLVLGQLEPDFQLYI